MCLEILIVLNWLAGTASVNASSPIICISSDSARIVEAITARYHARVRHPTPDVRQSSSLASDEQRGSVCIWAAWVPSHDHSVPSSGQDPSMTDMSELMWIITLLTFLVAARSLYLR